MSLQITWRMRVAALLVLSFLFRISDAEAPWSTTVPDVMAALAVATVAVMLLAQRRRGRVGSAA